ncbi:LacI family DNA-binding transcriptional regulator [Schleiferilactobacillus perolens]|uniref:Sucrose operon repressor n=1 Tax=Schleiferilactobacillus perolens DSM 12744 TaxID=1423792 RepID=A0A0R1N857_9LACO|nr:LacI family DNA-binding transcriptional regulator [Schleiferilactobacillus perolens]KRL14516.1 sucrose operon repressor [Schleiferilactobacillus perolens DSM 12744]
MTTLKDIARLAGVSTATVSRIINGKGEAGLDTIRKVNKIVAEMGYKPNTVAKTLSRRESSLIALLIPNLNNPFFSELVGEIERAANQHGFQIYLCNSEDDREKVEYYLETMADNYVMGAIINSLFVTVEDLRWLESRGISTITIDRTQLAHPYSAVAVDHVHGGYIAAKEVIGERHHQRLVFLSGPANEKSSEDRYAGYLKAVKEADAVNLGQLFGNFDITSGYQACYDFLQDGTIIDGIVSSNDAMALGAIRACQDLQRQVPKDIRIIGYDNTSYGAYSIPRLSTINQFKKKSSDIIIEELIRVHQHNQKAKKYQMEPELITRETT